MSLLFIDILTVRLIYDATCIANHSSDVPSKGHTHTFNPNDKALCTRKFEKRVFPPLGGPRIPSMLLLLNSPSVSSISAIPTVIKVLSSSISSFISSCSNQSAFTLVVLILFSSDSSFNTLIRLL